MREVSFFRRWKDFYLRQNKNVIDPEGRYIATCLIEVLRENKKFTKKFSPRKEIYNNTFSCEYSFSGKKQRRYADAVSLDRDGNPVVFIEIKMDDDFLSGQLSDYKRECKKTNADLIVITRYPVCASDRKIIRKDGNGIDLTWSHVREMILDSNSIEKNPITRFFLQFLEEENMIYTKLDKEDQNTINHYCKRLFLNSNNGQTTFGTGRGSTVFLIPDVQKKILSNLEYLIHSLFPMKASTFSYDLISCSALSINRKNICREKKGKECEEKVTVSVEDFAMIRSEKDKKRRMISSAEGRGGGILYFYASSYKILKKGHSEFGFAISKINSKNFDIYFYIQSCDNDIFDYVKIKFDISERDLVQVASELLKSNSVK